MSVGRFLQQAAAGAGGPSDDDFANVVLLLDGDGTSGDANNTFTDSSANGYTVTKSGSVVQGSFSPYGDNWSNYFNYGPYLTVPQNAAFNFGTGDFTVEFWVNVDTYRTSGSYFDAFVTFGHYTSSPYFRMGQDGKFKAGLVGIELSSTTVLKKSEWNHLAVTRSGTTVNLFVNGTLEATNTHSASLGNSAAVTIGTSSWQAANETMSGYISNLRIVKGTALYTSSFTPDDSPLTNVTNTSLLTCQSNRFIDNSSNGFTVSIIGTPKVTPFSPFKDSNARTLTTDGGSGYFDDSSNSYLQIADNSVFDATTSLCIEAWFYMTSSPGSGPDAHAIVSKWVSTTPGQRTVFIDIENTGLRVMFDIQGASNPVTIATDGGAIDLHSWHHVAVTWDGSTYRAFLDGALEGSTSNSSAPVASSQVIRVGYNTNSHYFGGYITDARWVTNGGAIYTSAFTPPTAPLTAITNTELLLNFQDAGIYDRSGINNLDTVGDAQIDTAVVKYGTGSMQFDETGDYLKVPSTDDIALGTGDFTIEGWLYIGTNPVGNGQGMFQISNGYLNSAVRGPAAGLNNGDGKWAIYYGTSQQTATAAAPSINTWYHVAYVRNSSTTKLYIDGTELISVSDSTNYSDTYLTIGGWYSTSYLLNGFIDDFRITKGIARYTSSFTPPTAALPKF